MNLTIRQEQVDDYELTESVVKSAFANAEHSDQKEHLLVSRIRKSQGFIPKLSLVATAQDDLLFWDIGNIIRSLASKRHPYGG